MTLTIEVAASTPATSTWSACRSSPAVRCHGRSGCHAPGWARSASTGKLGQTLTVPSASGPSAVAVGLGDAGQADDRRAAHGGGRAGPRRRHARPRWRPRWPTSTRRSGPRRRRAGGGRGLRARHVPLLGLQVGAGQAPPRAGRPARRGPAPRPPSPPARRAARPSARRSASARDLANTPPDHLTARRPGRAGRRRRGRAQASTIEVLDEDGDGRAGPRRPARREPRLDRAAPPREADLHAPAARAARVALVGKGITYDSGGISLKPSDGMHVAMKMDMTGAAVVLATMSLLPVLKPKVKVIGYLCCTDNMPSGSALQARRRADASATARPSRSTTPTPRAGSCWPTGCRWPSRSGADAIVDIATLTGAVHRRARARRSPGVMGNDDGWVDQVRGGGRPDRRAGVAAARCRREYRKLLDSDVADLKNVGGPYGGALTAGAVPAGVRRRRAVGPPRHRRRRWTATPTTAGSSKGATGFGVRLLADLLASYTPPR